MGRIVSTFFSTLDGVVEAPHEWHGPYFNEQMGAAMDTFQAETEAYLMGRQLYDEWAAYWPANEDADEFGPFINALPKYVVSTTLRNADWQGTTVVSPDPDAIRSLKAAHDGTIGMSGCATTVSWLLRERLVDELQLFVDPIVVGDGQRLFGSDEGPVGLTLAQADVFDNGVLHLRYRPNG